MGLKVAGGVCLEWAFPSLYKLFGVKSAWEDEQFSEFRTGKVKGKLFLLFIWLLQIGNKYSEICGTASR